MSTKNQRPQHLVGSLGYTSRKTTLGVKSVIEVTESGHANAIGWVIAKENGGSSTISMLQSSSSMRALSYALRELLKKGFTNYGDFTDPNLAGREGEKKRLRLNSRESGWFVNVSEGQKEISFGFSAYELLAFADQLKSLCEETDKMLFWHQRELAEQAKRNAHASMGGRQT